jgi:predicted nucleotidyltransferase
MKQGEASFPSDRFDGFPAHERIARRAFELLAAERQVLGIYLAGSFAFGQPDTYSDIDFYIEIPDRSKEVVLKNHRRIIEDVGEVATWFPATHLGDPSQLIVFYKTDPPVHVDYQYREVSELVPRSKDKDVLILLDREGHLARYRDASSRMEPVSGERRVERLQYLEDRFWAWCYYAHGKIVRGELWEARDAIEFMRTNVLLELADLARGTPFEGNRRVELKHPSSVQEALSRTVPLDHSRVGYAAALRSLLIGYEELFSELGAVTSQVRMVDRTYFRSFLFG